MLLVDKYRPQYLDKLDYHLDMAESLKNLASKDDFPHIIFYGPSGSGKKTRMMAFLRQIFGQSVEKIRIEKKSFDLPNKSTKIEATMLVSNCHVELTPSDNGYYDKLVVQEIIKETAKNQKISLGDNSRPFKVIILNQIDLLTKEAQHALRRTMEKYINNCRLIMYATNISCVIEALKSRSFCLRIAAPTIDEMVKILTNIANKESFQLPLEIAERISIVSERNLRKAILTLEATKAKQYPFQSDQKIQRTDWEIFIEQICDLILEQQSPSQLLIVREKYYELLTHCIPAQTIMKNLTLTLLKKVDRTLAAETIKWAAEFDHRMVNKDSPIIHLEAFTAKFMELYKSHIVNQK